MYPRQFEYVAPSSLDEALGALGEGSKVMAGGMSLIPLMKTRLFSPAVVVDIGRIPGLDAVSDEGDLHFGPELSSVMAPRPRTRSSPPTPQPWPRRRH